MGKSAFLIVLALGAFMFSCSSVKVTTDVNKTTDFSKYHTYSFLGWQVGSDRVINDFDKKRLYDAFDAEFEKRNLKFVEGGGDMAISLYFV